MVGTDLDEWGSEFSTFVRDALYSDLHAARVESRSNPHSLAVGAAVQHPAAS
jgi:hypothetical protein